MLADSELLYMNNQGLIPGPLETEEEFIGRVRSLKKTFEEGKEIPRAHWDWVRIHLKEIFDFEPHCLPAFYSNENLAPWQGAACWIENGKVVSVQMREGLRKGSYWGYSRCEILAHEAVHAARSAFEDSASEEFFAFMVSEKWWRRAFGPIVRRPWEVWVFFVLILLGTIVSWGHLVSALWISAGFWRLMKLHAKIRRSSKQLMKIIGEKQKVRAILMRLTDEEIELFSQGENILHYAHKQKCLRWRLIRLAYLGKIGAEVMHG